MAGIDCFLNCHTRLQYLTSVWKNLEGKQTNTNNWMRSIGCCNYKKRIFFRLLLLLMLSLDFFFSSEIFTLQFRNNWICDAGSINLKPSTFRGYVIKVELKLFHTRPPPVLVSHTAFASPFCSLSWICIRYKVLCHQCCCAMLPTKPYVEHYTFNLVIKKF